MNEEELEWVTNRHEGEIMIFKSPKGDIDTLFIHGISIFNSLDPINWGYFNTSSKEYIATADITYYFKNRKNGGILHIEKRFGDKPIVFSSVLIDDDWLYDVPLNVKSIQIGNLDIEDVMTFNKNNSDSTNPLNINQITCYSWSKTYGLLRYTFNDGTTFTRINIEG